MSTHSIGTIKARFSEFLREVEQGETIVISRHGKPVAALVRAEDLEQLRRLRSAGPQAGLAGLLGGWEDSDELVTHLQAIQRTTGRAD